MVIDRLYRSSAIMREKWEREDYRKSTIQKAIALCGGEFYTGKVPMPPFIWEDEKERRHVSCPLLAKYFREHQHMLSVRDTGRSGVQRYIYEEGCYRPYADEMITQSTVTGMSVESLQAYSYDHLSFFP